MKYLAVQSSSRSRTAAVPHRRTIRSAQNSQLSDESDDEGRSILSSERTFILDCPMRSRRMRERSLPRARTFPIKIARAVLLRNSRLDYYLVKHSPWNFRPRNFNPRSIYRTTHRRDAHVAATVNRCKDVFPRSSLFAPHSRFLRRDKSDAPDGCSIIGVRRAGSLAKEQSRRKPGRSRATGATGTKLLTSRSRKNLLPRRRG